MERERQQIEKITNMLADSEGRIQRGESDVLEAQKTAAEMAALEDRLQRQEEEETQRLKELEAAEESELLVIILRMLLECFKNVKNALRCFIACLSPLSFFDAI
jgi:hypothetical protein